MDGDTDPHDLLSVIVGTSSQIVFDPQIGREVIRIFTVRRPSPISNPGGVVQVIEEREGEEPRLWLIEELCTMTEWQDALENLRERIAEDIDRKLFPIEETLREQRKEIREFLIDNARTREKIAVLEVWRHSHTDDHRGWNKYAISTMVVVILSLIGVIYSYLT